MMHYYFLDTNQYGDKYPIYEIPIGANGRIKRNSWKQIVEDIEKIDSSIVEVRRSDYDNLGLGEYLYGCFRRYFNAKGVIRVDEYREYSPTVHRYYLRLYVTKQGRV